MLARLCAQPVLPAFFGLCALRAVARHSIVKV